jgi:hypothetical protein
MSARTSATDQAFVLFKTPRPSPDRPLAKSQMRLFLGNFVGPDRFKDDEGLVQEAFKTQRPIGRDQKGGGCVISEH